MRTTLDIDDDLLTAAEAIARERGKTLGAVISELARAALHKPLDVSYRNGVPLLPVRGEGAPVTLEIVNELRDETP